MSSAFTKNLTLQFRYFHKQWLFYIVILILFNDYHYFCFLHYSRETNVSMFIPSNLAHGNLIYNLGTLCTTIKILIISANKIHFSFWEQSPSFLFFNGKYLVKISTNLKLNKPHGLEESNLKLSGLAEAVHDIWLSLSETPIFSKIWRWIQLTELQRSHFQNSSIANLDLKYYRGIGNELVMILFMVSEPFNYNIFCSLYKEVLTLLLLEEGLEIQKKQSFLSLKNPT